MPGVHSVLDGQELAAATLPLLIGVDTPQVKRYPLAVDRARYAGEWVAAVVADSRALAEDAAEKVARRLRAAAVRARRRGGLPAGQPAGASRARLERAARPELRVGRGRPGFRRSAAPAAAPRQMGPQLHRADRDLRRGGELGPVARDARRLGLDPDAEISRPDRARAALPLRRARASGRRRRRQLRRQARHQAYGAGRLSLAPARLPGAADRGPAGEHARRRHARARARVRRRAGVRRTRRHPLHAHARARQCRRLCGPLAVPARQAGRRHRRPVPHQERRLSRHRGDHQQDAAGGGARLRPVAHQLRDRARHRGGGAAIAGSTGWRCGAATSSAPRSSPTSSRAAPPTTAATITP